MRNRETETRRHKTTGRSGSMPAVILGLLVLMALPSSQPLAQTGNAAVDLEATAVPEGAAWARIRHLEGEFTLYQDEAPDAAAGGLNAPVLPGDILETSHDGRLEIQMADGSVVWLDHDTRLSVLTLADGRSRFENQTLFSLESGSLMIQMEAFSSDDELFRIDTQAATIYLLEEGLYRIEAASSGGTQVTSRRGVAEILAAEQSMLVRSGEGGYTAAGYPPGTPRIVRVADQDAFDVFVSRRRQLFLSQGAASYAAYNDEIPVEVQPYLVEMDSHGTWSRHPSYGAIWVPRVSAGWRPYTYGYWHRRRAGNVWVSYDPWGYAPYHYGRWEYLPAYGWSWMPGGLYSPAWVSWGYSGNYVGWSPVGWYNYPSGWNISISFGVFNASYWNFVDYGHFHHHHVDRVVVKEHHLARDMTYAARPPHMDRAGTDGPRARREEAIFTRARAEAQRAPVNMVAGRHAQGTRRESFRQQEVRATTRERERVALQTTARTATPTRRSAPVTAQGQNSGRSRSSSARREPATRQVETAEPRRILTDNRTRRSPGNSASTTSRRPSSSTGRSTTGRSTTSRSTTGRSTTSRSTTGRSTTSRSTTSRSTTGRSTTGRSTTGRSTTPTTRGTSRPEADRSRSSQAAPDRKPPRTTSRPRSTSSQPATPSRGSSASRSSRQATKSPAAKRNARTRTESSAAASPSRTATRPGQSARSSRSTARTRPSSTPQRTTSRSKPAPKPSATAPRSSSTARPSRDSSRRAAAPQAAAPSAPRKEGSRSTAAAGRDRGKGSDKGRRR